MFPTFKRIAIFLGLSAEITAGHDANDAAALESAIRDAKARAEKAGYANDNLAKQRALLEEHLKEQERKKEDLLRLLEAAAAASDEGAGAHHAGDLAQVEQDLADTRAQLESLENLCRHNAAIIAESVRETREFEHEFAQATAPRMKPRPIPLFLALPFLSVAAAAAGLPPAAQRPVDFEKDLKPLIETTCVKCHAKGKSKGGFSLETRAALLKGGETGAGAEPGHSAKSLIVEAVAGLDPDFRMPKKGSLWTPEQVGLLRAWIDQGASWPEGVTFAKPEPLNLKPRPVTLAARPSVHPLDRLIAPYFARHGVEFGNAVADRVFARRVYLDLIGLLPTPDQLDTFLRDPAPDKRARLVRTILADRRNYPEHWLSFWNDLLRNDYKGTGFIDGGRKQVSGWLYTALAENKPYDRFVAELVNPSPQSEGFTHGIIWRGNVPAAMLPPMQAAQNVSQVFLGVNLKCASCHDSFVNDWSLADAYGMAAIYADEPLEMIHCDKPTGDKTPARFLYAQLGALDGNATRPQRTEHLARLLTERNNGRLSRTIVNRLWARLFGRGIVEPLDDMEKPAFDADVLDWLAEDLVAHNYDLKHTLETICTSRTYQLAAVESDAEGEAEDFVFRGPWTRRLSAEQFTDAVSALTGQWAKVPSSLEFDFAAAGVIAPPTMPAWLWTDEPLPADRHRVVFRKTFELDEVPTQAYGVVLASQRHQVFVNGTEAKPIARDGFRRGLIALLDLQPLLKAGPNVIIVEVESHTEKSMNDDEAAKYPDSRMHLNPRSGATFYARCLLPSGPVEWTADDSWRVRRGPDGDYRSASISDADWPAPKVVPPDASPIDQGPALPPINRQDFANIPVELGPALSPAVSTVANAGRIRASLLAADPLQVALDRPNREVVVPARATAATTIQALELTNGAVLDDGLKAAANGFVPSIEKEKDAWIEQLFLQAFSRPASAEERAVAAEILAPEDKAQAIADLLWVVVNHPEFQFIN